jgi:hypothetical protein
MNQNMNGKNVVCAVCAAAVLLTALAGCKGTSASSALAGSGTSSAEALGSSASSLVSGAPASGSVSGVSSAAAVSAQSAPEKVYSVKTQQYKFKQGKKYYRAEYPQLSSSSADCSKVNSLMKNTALKTILAYGTGNTAAYAEARVSSHVAYRSDDFISVIFQEKCSTSSSAEDTENIRTVNYDLKSGKAVSADDMVQKNAVLSKALNNAVQKQMSKKKAASYPSSVIQSGISSCSIYFKNDGMTFCVPVSKKLGSFVKLSVKYSDTAGFRTNHSSWNYFIKK